MMDTLENKRNNKRKHLNRSVLKVRQGVVAKKK